jgi:hypothetical protein
MAFSFDNEASFLRQLIPVVLSLMILEFFFYPGVWDPVLQFETWIFDWDDL